MTFPEDGPLQGAAEGMQNLSVEGTHTDSLSSDPAVPAESSTQAPSPTPDQWGRSPGANPDQWGPDPIPSLNKFGPPLLS